MNAITDDDRTYDVVIVGAGFSGAILAKELVSAGHTVLILEAGADHGKTWETYRSYLDQYYLSLAKTPNSPYPDLPTLPSPSVLDITAVRGTEPDTNGYFVQRGPLPFGSNYLRAYGGTSLHWLGTSLRMMPADFEMQSRFGQGVDWPFGYKDIRSDYERAEWEIGVSADAEEQTPRALGIKTSGKHDNRGYFAKGYDFPMHSIPSSYIDGFFARADGMPIEIGEDPKDTVKLKVSRTPQGRNSTPRKPKNANGIPVGRKMRYQFRPRGSTGPFAYMGQRCEGNSSCIPICPIQAKYNAMKTLEDAKHIRKHHMKTITQAVASKVELAESGRVSGIVYKKYSFSGVAQYELRRAKGKQYVLAGGAVENVTLALASEICRTSGELGRNLMDHPYMMTWGSAPEPVGPFRGPGSTSSYANFRDGTFRDRTAAHRLEIGNWGWNFATGAPNTDVARFVEQENLFGKALRDKLYHDVQRQVRIGTMVEQLPRSTNRVTIDPAYRTPMGEYRPVISYDLDDYSRAGLATAYDTCTQIFQRLGIRNHTAYNPSDAGYFTYDGRGYTFFGAGHLVGTHRIGTHPRNSVTNDVMRTWDHDNLWMVGAGSMPTIATSNPTLTMSAMAYRASRAISDAVRKGGAK
ncbi:GMC family oxidoreductase (plasmid) [Ruegeria sp. SCSIO 43209]|uniref:GMC family oxidoreductase n=1 Tax=Ruegeria sp. SCSIO 43209 TaxID=2793010 RepID=UPI00148091B5|nr:GMC family oxidoreductase [Ruegeria sp. SCSIO 43209]UAB91514.1 GMC family oxidoreductase [Ruegeria sp. SCSIO 43209]